MRLATNLNFEQLQWYSNPFGSRLQSCPLIEWSTP